MLKIGLIGCGLIGEKRLRAIRHTGLGEICSVYDTNHDRQKELARNFGARVAQDAKSLFEDTELVIVATPNGLLSEYSLEAIHQGKHVLVEKPAGISSSQITLLVQAVKERGQGRCKVGYNHRFHGAAEEMDRLLQSSPAPIWIRAAYGHGGRPGYEKEWRFDPAHSGGGELIDQGVHILDLIQWWCGDLSLLHADLWNACYPAKVEDNVFLSLKTKAGTSVQLHCSVTQWKNIFRIEIATPAQLLVWEGLGNKNYGPETLKIYDRNPQGGAPAFSERLYENSSELSWEREWEHFYRACQDPKVSLHSSIEESMGILSLIEQVYQ